MRLFQPLLLSALIAAATPLQAGPLSDPDHPLRPLELQLAELPSGVVGRAGRHLVLTPWSPRVGVSRRIDSDKERRRLREVVERHRPKDLGFIIRTAGDGLKESDLEADIKLRAKQDRNIHDSALVHASVKERFERLKSRNRSPALRAFLKIHGNSWSQVRIEP